MTIVDVENLDQDLRTLVARAMTGDDVLISRGGVPIAKLVRIEEAHPARRRLGLLEGLISTSPDFDDLLPDEILAAFEGR